MAETNFFSSAWDRLVQPGIDQAMQRFAAEQQLFQQQIDQANLRAQEQAQMYTNTVINNAMQSVAQKYQPEVQSLQQQARDLQDYAAGKTSSVRVLGPMGRMTTLNAQDFPPNSDGFQSYVNRVQQRLQRFTDPTYIRREALENIALNQIQSPFTPNLQDVNALNQFVTQELFNTALPQAENAIVRPILGQLETLQSQRDREMYNINTAGDQTARQASAEMYNFLSRRGNEVTSEINRLRDAGELTPEREAALQGALQAEANFLSSPQFGFTPESYQQAENVYQQAFQGLLPPPAQVTAPLAEQVTQPTAAQPVTQPAPQTTPQVTPQATQPVTSQLATPVTQPVTPVTPVTQPVAPVTTPVAAPVTPVTQPVAQPVAQQPIPSSAFLSAGIPSGVAAQPTPTTTGTPMATTLNPANLPELRSAGGGGTSAIDPTLRPYLELGLRAAEQQFLQTQPQFFPGQTYVSPSQQTLDALAAQEQIARAAPSSLQAAQESYMRGLGGLASTAQGSFLMGNPYQQAAIQASTRPVMQQFTEQTLPGIASGFSRAGRYGSGAMERALGTATEATSRALGDIGANLAYRGYETERGLQNQAITQQINAAQMAPQIYGQQFLPSQQLAQIGAARETISGLPLQEQMARFQFSQQAPRESLNAFLSSIYGTPMGRSQYSPTPEIPVNRAGQVLGDIATGIGVISGIQGLLS
jgi:hypothetical protein